MARQFDARVTLVDVLGAAEPIADPPHRLDERARSPELLAKAFDVGVHGARLHVQREPPDLGEQHLPGADAALPRRERVKETDGVRLVLDIWCRSQKGEMTAVGTASAVVS